MHHLPFWTAFAGVGFLYAFVTFCAIRLKYRVLTLIGGMATLGFALGAVLAF
jgi:hypothetical protein